MTVWVDANHADNLANRRSHTGFIIFVNQASILWYSKKQSTVEASSFGLELNALRVAVEHVIALRFKLRMFGTYIQDYLPIPQLSTRAKSITIFKNLNHSLFSLGQLCDDDCDVLLTKKITGHQK